MRFHWQYQGTDKARHYYFVHNLQQYSLESKQHFFLFEKLSHKSHLLENYLCADKYLSLNVFLFAKLLIL